MHKPRNRDFARHLEQNESAGDIGLNYGSGLVDASIDVGLSGKMDNGVTTTHRRFYSGCIADVAFHEFIIRIVRH